MKIKKFDDYINEYGFNKDGEPYGFKEEDVVFNITRLTSLQAKKLIDFLESDIEILDDEDFSYYEDVTGIDTDSLGELYIGYGFNANKYKETDKLKAEYEKSSKKTWKQVSDEADDAE